MLSSLETEKNRTIIVHLLLSMQVLNDGDGSVMLAIP
jgi:hypothetical protein